MEHETAGDPMTGLKWTHRTTAKIAAELHSLGIEISDRTVAKLLKQMDFSLRVDHKKLSRVSPKERDAQFAHIAELREHFAAKGLPLISVDTKKKELVGLFKNGGVAWRREPLLVSDHDFRSDAEGILEAGSCSFAGPRLVVHGQPNTHGAARPFANREESGGQWPPPGRRLQLGQTASLAG